MQKNLIIIYTAILALSLSSCTRLLPEPHKIDIQQGNKVKYKDFSQLKLGMSHEQVKFLLGTPLLVDGFSTGRWDYMHYLKPGKGEPVKSQLVLYFTQGELSTIGDSQYVAEKKEDVSLTK